MGRTVATNFLNLLPLGLVCFQHLEVSEKTAPYPVSIRYEPGCWSALFCHYRL